MTRALHLAGARTVIASRWSLEDESTLEFMRELYQARERGVRQGNAALHEACRAVLASRRQGGRTTHPFYWASFTASGD
jgi:CHAT domain-containing protein